MCSIRGLVLVPVCYFNKLGLGFLDLPVGLALVSWHLLVSLRVLHLEACVGFGLFFNKLGLEILDLPVGLALVSWLLLVSLRVLHLGACVGFGLFF